VGLFIKFLLNFKALTIIQAPHQKNFFFRSNYYNLAIHVVTLTKIFLMIYWDSKVQGRTIESRKK
jgi:hypothetical protein